MECGIVGNAVTPPRELPRSGALRTSDGDCKLTQSDSLHRLAVSLGFLNAQYKSSPAATGRNDNCFGSSDMGSTFFAKRIGGESAKARFERQIAFEATRRASEPRIVAPRLLGYDAHSYIAVYEDIVGAAPGHVLDASDSFGEDLALLAGRTIAALHTSPVLKGMQRESTPVMWPTVPDLEALPQAKFSRASGATLELWRLLQRDPLLIEGLRARNRAENEAPSTPIHDDIRLDQFLASREALYLCDWEEFKLGDPARDVGRFAGEWLYRAVLKLSDDGGDASPDADAHQKVMSRGVQALDSARAKIVAFLRGYEAVIGPGTARFGVRATAVAGRHVIDRVFASADAKVSLTAIDRAAVGIGRTAIIGSEEFAQPLGLGF